ncbi:hypothetical protein I79_014996 [Cricetulus griseus]|uniref:Uncharacterized protein n=1 Tax=Cricetulus griseus TaxID=10029 RepID=G3HVK7_CRIGR|nr:hypothetical protein I79_014996 [Cricetulus griseus]
MIAEEIIFFKLFLYLLRTTKSGRRWWLKSANPALRRLRQGDCYEPKPGLQRVPSKPQLYKEILS